MSELTLGVVATSRKEHESRLRSTPGTSTGSIRICEAGRSWSAGTGCGTAYGDDELETKVGGLRSREELIAECDIVVLPKPLHEDVAALRSGQVLWGWPHCVQDTGLTQLAIDRRLTVIAWEAMNHWTRDGAFSLHVFHKNNELAGYCSVLHASSSAALRATTALGCAPPSSASARRPAARSRRCSLSASTTSRCSRSAASRRSRRRCRPRTSSTTTATMPIPPAGPALDRIRSAARSPSTWPSTTSSSTASSRTPTIR